MGEVFMETEVPSRADQPSHWEFSIGGVTGNGKDVTIEDIYYDIGSGVITRMTAEGVRYRAGAVIDPEVSDVFIRECRPDLLERLLITCRCVIHGGCLGISPVGERLLVTSACCQVWWKIDQPC